MKRKMHKRLIWLVTACMVLTLLPMTSLAVGDVPMVKSGQETQTGTAVPASGDTLTTAVPYSADMSGWFEDTEADPLTYSVVSAEDASSNDVSADVSITDNTITYIPAAAQASQDVTIVIKANDGSSDGTSNVTITVTVGAVPADANNAPTDYYTIAIGDQSAGGAGYNRNIVIEDHVGTGLSGKYLVVQYTSGTGESAKVAVMMIALNDSSSTVTVSYQTSETTVETWLTNGMPDLAAADLGVIVYANANSN